MSRSRRVGWRSRWGNVHLIGLALMVIFSGLSLSAGAQSLPGEDLLVDKERLSWSINDRPVREVLQELSLHLGFELTISAKLPVQTVSAEFSSVTAEQALTVILAEQNYILARSPNEAITHLYLFAEGETPSVAPQTSAATEAAPGTQKRKLIEELEALLPPGTLTQTMKEALLAGAIPPSAAEIAELRTRQSAIFEEFKAQFDALDQSRVRSGNQ